MSEARKTLFGVGEAVPWFRAPVVDGSPDYAFETVGGKIVLMLFFGTASDPTVRDALAGVMRRRALFDDEAACFFGVTVDPGDAAEKRIRQALPGLRFVLDHGRAVSAAFGAAPDGAGYRPHWLLLDRTLRVAGRFALDQGDAALAATAALASAPPAQDWAPVVAVPDVLERELCRRLIELYEADGGEASGFMRDVDGKTKLILDPAHKIRRDWLIEDPELARALNLRLIHRLLPMVRRAFSFQATRVERLLVGCYEAETGGHFRAHRDNTTKGTAHRRFAVTINLNAEDYEGGDLNFPEFGPRLYRAATGGAIAFSCSLLHRAMPVTKGRRFAFLPFLYDEPGAELRERNAGFLEGEAANYRADQDMVIR